MVYVEWLRARRRLIIFMAIIVGLVALNLIPLLFGHTHSDGHGDFSVGLGSGQTGASVSQRLQQMAGNYRVPLSALLGVSALLTLIFTTTLGSSLNAQNDSLNLAFTRPVSRLRLALEFFGIDMAAILTCYVLCFLVALIPFAALGLTPHLYADPYIAAVSLLGIGASFMFYGILQSATAWLRGGAGLIIGLSWPIFLIAAIPGTPPFGVLANAILDVVRFFDPIVYLRTAMTQVGVQSGFGILTPFESSSLAVWVIGFAGCVLATYEWKRLEV
jgi:hypothetical protein